MGRRFLPIPLFAALACLTAMVATGVAQERDAVGRSLEGRGTGFVQNLRGSPPDRHRRWRPHIAAAKRYAERRAGDVAFAVIDPHGKLHGLHMGRTAPTASVVKVMLLVAYLRKRDGHRLSRGDRDLLAPMIRRSDNVAATEIRDRVGRVRIERLARVAEMRDFHYHPIWGQSETSPRDQAWFMYRLHSYIPRKHRPYARFLLSHVIRAQRWGIARVVPRGWALFFKGGWGSGTGLVDHQVALLRRRHRRVALAILTQSDPDHSYGKRTLRGVAARVLSGLER